MQGNKFSGASPGLNWVRRLDRRTKLFLLAAGLTLLATTPADELFLGLVKLRLPYPGAFAFALARRWVPEVFATAMRVKEAQAARGLSWEREVPWTACSYDETS